MNLCVVLAGVPQHFDDLAKRRAGLLRPIYDTGNGLLTVLYTIEFLLGNKYVYQHFSRRRHQESKVLAHLNGAHKIGRFTLNNLDNLSFKLLATSSCEQADTYFIAVEGFTKIPRSNQNISFCIWANHVGIPITRHIYDSFCVDGVVLQFVFPAVDHDDLARAFHITEGHLNLRLYHCWFVAKLGGQLLVIKFSCGIFAKYGFQRLSIFLYVNTLRTFLGPSVVFSRHILR